MNPSTDRALARLLRSVERAERRRAGRRGGPPASAIALGLGLAVGVLLLSAFVPAAWPALGIVGPGGPPAGWYALVWAASAVARRHAPILLASAGGVSIAGLLLGWKVRLLRPLIWLAALAVLLADASVVALTLRPALTLAPF